MRDIAAALLASLLVLISLMSLIAAEQAQDTRSYVVMNNGEKIADLRLRFSPRK